MTDNNIHHRVGIDYSITSPSITISHPTDNDFNKSRTYFVTSIKKYVGVLTDNITGIAYPEWDHPIDRYVAIANLLREKIPLYSKIHIEDYAFAAKGKVFHIAENTCILKYFLHVSGINYETIPPTTLKKFATGKGNANKEAMYDAFLKKTNITLKEKLAINKIASPLSDIVDSYYLSIFR